jgi:hypothetical protein
MRDLGCPATELAGDLQRAAAVVEHGHARIGAALLDINLGGTTSFAVAALLKEKNIPFARLTGYDHEVVPGRLR